MRQIAPEVAKLRNRAGSRECAKSRRKSRNRGIAPEVAKSAKSRRRAGISEIRQISLNPRKLWKFPNFRIFAKSRKIARPELARSRNRARHSRTYPRIACANSEGPSATLPVRPRSISEGVRRWAGLGLRRFPEGLRRKSDFWLGRFPATTDGN